MRPYIGNNKEITSKTSRMHQTSRVLNKKGKIKALLNFLTAHVHHLIFSLDHAVQLTMLQV